MFTRRLRLGVWRLGRRQEKETHMSQSQSQEKDICRTDSLDALMIVLFAIFAVVGGMLFLTYLGI